MPSYTICYTKTESGYTGQLLEWPEVISEGATLEECRSMVEDAAREMTAVYVEDVYPQKTLESIFKDYEELPFKTSIVDLGDPVGEEKW
jgi:predicted RNase H-like HicB family nuclease